MVPANSRKVSPASRYSGYPPSCHRYAYRTITVCGWAFQTHSTSNNTTPAGPTTPNPVGPGLGYSPFARHYSGNHYCFLFLLLLRCFSSERMPPRKDIPEGMGCPIRTPTDQHFCAAPRGFSQLYTSFIASACQGIHRVPLITSIIRLALAALAPERTKTPNTSSQ